MSLGSVVASIATSATLVCLAGCGGGTDVSGGPTSPSYAYVTSASYDETQPDAVYQYAVGTDGTLTSLSTASITAGRIPTSVVSDPAGRYVYVVNYGDETISQYVVGTGGGLVPLSPVFVSVVQPFPTIAGYAASIDPSGRFLYVVVTPRDPPSPMASIAQYSIGSDGTLTPLTPSYVNVPAAAVGPLAIEPSGHYAYLAGATTASGGWISQFSLATDGTLSALTPPGVAATEPVAGIAIAPGGHTAYVLSSCINTDCDGQVARYTLGADGTLTATGSTVPTGGHVIPIGMVFDTSGSSAYLLTNLMGVDTDTGALQGYSINSAGDLVPDTPTSVGVGAGAMAASAVAETTYGPNLYALSSNAIGPSVGFAGGHIDHYAIGAGGQLSALGTVTVAAGAPTGIAVVTTH
jgi:6-phosphogluconolactonase (cycloisomerase 2 family)